MSVTSFEVAGSTFLTELHSELPEKCLEYFEEGLYLKLNPHCLSYLQNLSDESESEDPDVDKRIVYQLFHLLLPSLICLRIESPTRDDSHFSIDLSRFTSLVALSVNDFPFASIRGTRHFQKTLHSLEVHRSVSSLREILTPTDNIRPERRRSRIKKSWNLVSLNCSENHLSSIDSSLRFCPKLVFLDLSNNNIPEIKRLQHCRDLQHLNISFNVLCDLRGITDNLLNIRSLVLKGNQISDTSGLEYCPTLTQLDLTANLIADPEACIALSSLPQLSELWLSANPISYSRQYNAWVRKLFGFRLNEGDFYLDGKKLTNRCRVLCCFRRRSKDAPSLTSYDTSSVGYSSRSMLLPKPSIGYRKPTKRTSKSSRRVVTIHDMNSSPSAAAKKFAESRSYIPPSPRSDSQTLTGCCVGAIRPHSRMEPAPRPHRTPRIPAAASRSQLSCVYSPVSSRAPSLPSHITPLSYSDGSPMSLSKSPGDRPLPMLTPEEVMVSQLFDEKSDSEASAGHAQHRVAEVATTVSDCQSDYDHQSPVYAHRSGRDIPVSHRLRSEQD
eukprot:732038_1